MTIEQDLMDVLKKYSKKEFTYINPNFLQGIEALLWDYFELEDDEVDEWITGMWSA